MAKILITGATGFIGTQLVAELLRDKETGIIALTRQPARHRNRFPTDRVQLVDNLAAIPASTPISAVINLAGEGIADKPWSDQRKQVLFDSRLGVTRELIALLRRLERKPRVMISGSAIGYYGCRDAMPLDEDAEPVQEFTHELCRQWEEAAAPATDLGIRLCITRLGVVLGTDGGLIKRLSLPFRLCLGGRIGDGAQMMSWIHMVDLLAAFKLLLQDESLRGVFNLTAPNAVSNRDFTRAMGDALNRPTLLPMPAFVVKRLFGEMGEVLLLSGQHVVPRRLVESGFQWSFPDIQAALDNLL